MLSRRALFQRKTEAMLKKTSKITYLILMFIILAMFQLSAQQLTHQMSEEEKALMPSYLESLKYRIQSGPPLAPVRNIAEFEPMEGVLIAYPLGIPVELVAEMSEDVMVTTIVDSLAKETQARRTYSDGGVNLNNCNFLYADHDSWWTRDYGPWFVMEGDYQISIINFIYNRPRPDDNNIPIEMAAFLGIDYFDMDLLHTGGNYMTDGWGISASTDLVWEENPDYTTTQVDQMVYDYLGVSTYHVMHDPLDDYIKHIDCWGKYLDVDKVLIGRVPSTDSRYSDYEAVAAYFSTQTTGYGNYYQVFRVDSPNGEPYTNSLILNKKVLVPIMGTGNDSAALTTYSNAMPGYEVIGFTGDWYSTDALHCRVKGIADRGVLYIKHSPLIGEKPVQTQYEISAEIIPYSGMSVIQDSVKIYYKINDGSFISTDMSNVSGNLYNGYIPGQAEGSEIAYYLHAEDTSGRSSDHPYIGWPDPHVFFVSFSPVPPDAQFSADNLNINEGETVQFTDLSTGPPTSWYWTFPGGTPGTSTEQNPQVTYYEAGTYSVILTVTNDTGDDTETKIDYITVSVGDDCLGEITNPGFETGSTSGWSVTGSVNITTSSYAGSYAVSLETGGSTVQQVISDLCPNTTYTLSAWGKAKSNADFYLGVSDFSGTQQTVQFADNNNWQQKSITFTTGPSNTSATVLFIKNSNSQFAGLGDDFALIKVN